MFLRFSVIKISLKLYLRKSKRIKRYAQGYVDVEKLMRTLNRMINI
jgi:hypothetical protein